MMIIFPAAAMAAVAAAPMALFGERGPTVLPFARNHVAAWITGGAYFTNGQTWTQSANVQSVYGSRFAELDVEQFNGRRHLRYSVARAGLLFHPGRHSAGGVTLGYQTVDRDRRQRGVEVGLPLVAGDSAGAELRIVPTYVFSGPRVLWSLRSEIIGPIAHSPYFAGVHADFRTFTRARTHGIDYSSGTIAALVGTRF